jgi:hypothetical protein
MRRVATLLLALAVVSVAVYSQVRGSRAAHVTIPFLANASKPADLDFQAGNCRIQLFGSTMICEFHQVFLTTNGVSPDTCFVTTNSYDVVFKKDGPGHWTSTEGPQGPCGIVDVTSLQDGGTVKWTMETRKVVTKKDAPACRQVDEQSEIQSWQNVRRELPCRFVQPGLFGG